MIQIDYAKWAERQRKQSMDRDEWRHVLSEGIAYAVVLGASAVTFILAVCEVSK